MSTIYATTAKFLQSTHNFKTINSKNGDKTLQQSFKYSLLKRSNFSFALSMLPIQELQKLNVLLNSVIFSFVSFPFNVSLMSCFMFLFNRSIFCHHFCHISTSITKMSMKMLAKWKWTRFWNEICMTMRKWVKRENVYYISFKILPWFLFFLNSTWTLVKKREKNAKL